MKRSTIRFSLAGIATFMVLAGASRLMFAPPTSPPLVATIDLERLFNGLDIQKTEGARVDAVAVKYDTQLDGLRGQIENLQAELENFEQGGEAWLKTSRDAEAAISEYQAIEQFARLKVEAERAKSMRNVYERIKSEIETFAKAQTPPLDLVLIDDTIPVLEPSTAEAMQKQISARRMIYASSAFDITDILLERINASGGTGG
jgi:Skp family chaperone for outer membrane proteins